MNLKNKDEMRNLIWYTLKRKKISKSPKNWHGRIPDFYGSDLAAGMLRNTAEWKNSGVIFSSPDSAQKKVREYALLDYKTLIMASPNLERGYILIRPLDARGNEKTASTKEGAFKFGETIRTFPEVDLVVEGSVAVDMSGGRLGKGKGYGDAEISHLFKEKSIDEHTTIATTVHETQIVDKVPRETHDQKINMVVTPERVIRIGKEIE
jgi:5-formyltetrahydrofolate cyclo-ligase